MKNNSVTAPNKCTEPTVDDTRAYAFHLYQQSNCQPGHDLDNWLEASACLKANIPSHQTHARLHHHCNAQESGSLRTPVSAGGTR